MARGQARVVRRWPAPARRPGGELGLRLLRPDDRPAFLASIDHEVRYQQGFDDRAVAAYARLFDALGSRFARRWVTEQHLAVEWRGRFSGTYSIGPCRTEGVDVQLGWWLAPQARTRGLGRASLAEVLDHVHDTLGFRVARMGTSVDNLRAVRQIEAVGAVPVEMCQHHLPDGRLVTGRWYHHTAS